LFLCFLDALGKVNQARYQEVHDPEIASRIASYELAYRMQMAAPELTDLSNESQATLDAYGFGRGAPPGGGRGKQGDTHISFSRNCLSL